MGDLPCPIAISNMPNNVLRGEIYLVHTLVLPPIRANVFAHADAADRVFSVKHLVLHLGTKRNLLSHLHSLLQAPNSSVKPPGSIAVSPAGVAVRLATTKTAESFAIFLHL